MKFGEQIKAIRKENNLTQEQFGEKLSVTRQVIIPGIEPTSVAVQRSLTAHRPIYLNPRFSPC